MNQDLLTTNFLSSIKKIQGIRDKVVKFERQEKELPSTTNQEENLRKIAAETEFITDFHAYISSKPSFEQFKHDLKKLFVATEKSSVNHHQRLPTYLTHLFKFAVKNEEQNFIKLNTQQLQNPEFVGTDVTKSYDNFESRVSKYTYVIPDNTLNLINGLFGESNKSFAVIAQLGDHCHLSTINKTDENTLKVKIVDMDPEGEDLHKREEWEINTESKTYKRNDPYWIEKADKDGGDLVYNANDDLNTSFGNQLNLFLDAFLRDTPTKLKEDSNSGVNFNTNNLGEERFYALAKFAYDSLIES